jgi:hypothetical protein
MYRKYIVKRMDLSSFRIEFVEGWYMKYADVEQNARGRFFKQHSAME